MSNSFLFILLFGPTVLLLSLKMTDMYQNFFNVSDLCEESRVLVLRIWSGQNLTVVKYHCFKLTD